MLASQQLTARPQSEPPAAIENVVKRLCVPRSAAPSAGQEVDGDQEHLSNEKISELSHTLI